jgi:hypothetical protein
MLMENIFIKIQKLLIKNKNCQSAWVFAGLESFKWAVLNLRGPYSSHPYPPSGS